MFLTTRYRGPFTNNPPPFSQSPCYKNWERNCWIAFIALALILSVSAFTAVDDTVTRLVIGSLLFLIGLGLMFCFWMRRVYQDSVERRARNAQRKDRRTKSEAIIQISGNHRGSRLSEDLEETLPLDEPPPYESLKT